MTETKRMSVEYYVIKVVHYGGITEMDVPLDKLDANGKIDLDRARENFPYDELEVAHEDCLDERLGGEEYAHATGVSQS